ncbi:hypothetical protein [Halobacterium sp. CBA1126]|uniref:hypothetical protein n=1 Tax=Halobacterium sp. CBA1126 TaxID=2668074 RepID=UPI0012F845B5|nr:hypothetical protein [Halobacterium sp. CBA1126]MUV61318.1 hypothetical protein [Halobacterium sp. CBA1126]
MSARARRAAVLALLAAVLLVNPVYVPHLVDAEESASGTTYDASAVDLANAGDRERLVYAVGQDDVVDVNDLAEANEHAVYGDEYRVPEAAAGVLERATENGTASTSDADASFTLRRVAANHEFAVVGDDSQRYYRIDAAASGNETSVTATEATREAVARYLVHHDAVLYASLPEHQRAAVDAVVEAGDTGYMPESGERLWELTDSVVVRDDTYYVVQPSGVADDFGPSPRGFARLALNAVGALAFLAALVLTVLAYRRPER